ncbi:YhjD/YihY/BrkB family envelope integrity protein [Halalkalicoccus tibetensis]|uniref:YhjD/YihY/BrkB family envelope integrity protein n=1 Tax=Halalkalicoccus tibetensis TaxID=175632 RepID=A0ABD5V552_9EURY
MNRRIGNTVDIGRAVVEEVQENEATFLAASIAYYAFVSLIPLLAFVFIVASVVGGQELANQIVAESGEYLAPAGQDALDDAITAEAGRGGATVVSVVVLLWSALKLFRGLDTAFSLIYGAGLDKSIVGQVINAVIVFGAIIVAAIGMIGLGALLVFLPDFPFGLLTPLFLIAGLSLVFLPMYYVLPDVEDLSIKQALPGAAFAAFGWALLHTFFGLYASNAGQYDAYGAIGGILLLLTWLYIGGVVIILGGVVNYVLMERNNDTSDSDVEEDESKATRATPGTPSAEDGTADVASEATSDEDSSEPSGSGTTRAATDSPRGPSPEIGAETEEATDSTRTASEEAATGTRGPAPDVVGLQDEVRSLRADLDTFRADIESKTVGKEEVESDLKKYVRKRIRRGHATGWGPYLVLLYGTIMTLGAFFFLSGGWAIAAMIVLWLSTLGLYAVMVTVGAGLGVLGFPGRINDAIRNWRGN